MSSVARTSAMLLALATVAVVLSMGITSQAMAQPRVTPGTAAPLLAPGVGMTPPRVGYWYQAIPGYGFRVIGVEPGSPAAFMGLEIGDIVLALNGFPLTYYGADLPARAQAVQTGGWITMRILDVRSGMIVVRSANLFGPGMGAGAPAAAASQPAQ